MLSLEFSFSLLIVHSPAHHNCLNSVYVYFKLKEFLFEHISRSLLKFCGWKKIYILWKYWQCCKLFGILGKILLLFKKFNRVFFSIYNCKKFRIVFTKKSKCCSFYLSQFQSLCCMIIYNQNVPPIKVFVWKTKWNEKSFTVHQLLENKSL